MSRYKLRYFSDIAGRIYMMYRNQIWYGFNRSEDIPVGERKSWKYIYLPAPVEDSMDLFSLIWLASYRGSIEVISYDDAQNLASTLFKRKVKLRNGEYVLLKRLGYLSGLNHYTLIVSAKNVLREVEILKNAKRRVMWLHPDLLKLSTKSKIHPLCYVFAKSTFFYIKRWKHDQA